MHRQCVGATLNAIGFVALVANAQAQLQSDWSEVQWQDFEDAQFMKLVRILAEGNPYLKAELQADESQLPALEHTLEQLSHDFQELQREQMFDLRMLKLMNAEGNQELVAEIQADLEQEQRDIRVKHLESGIRDALRPNQERRLRQIAKQLRYRQQSGLDGDFGVIYEIARNCGIDEVEKRRLLGKIEDAESSYLSRLEEYRAEALERVIRTLSAEKRDLLNEMYGDFYNYNLEARRGRSSN